MLVRLKLFNLVRGIQRFKGLSGKRNIIFTRGNPNYVQKPAPQYEITIKNDYVDQQLCDLLFKHRPFLIKNIPVEFHTMHMYKIMCEKYPHSIASMTLKDTLRKDTLAKLIKQKILLVYYSKENLNNFTVDNFVFSINDYPYNIQYVPEQKLKSVLQKLPGDFFTMNTLDQLSDFVIDAKLFKEYFGHIELFKLTDSVNQPLRKYYLNNSYMDDGYGIPNGTGYYNLPEDNVTWDPEKFIESTSWKKVTYIKPATLPDGSSQVKIMHYYVTSIIE
jgi:hypothetical protein